MTIEHETSQRTNRSLSSQTRRSALKKMLVGTGVAAGATVLPDKWIKPLVDRVLVPAHAQTSTTTTTTTTTAQPSCGEEGYLVPVTGEPLSDKQLTFTGISDGFWDGQSDITAVFDNMYQIIDAVATYCIGAIVTKFEIQIWGEGYGQPTPTIIYSASEHGQIREILLRYSDG